MSNRDRRLWLIVTAVFTVNAALMACYPPPAFEIATVGGPKWRVTDAVKHNAATQDYWLGYSLESVQECIGQERSIADVDLYSASAIVYQLFPGVWANADGMWLGAEKTQNGRDRIYYSSRMGPKQREVTLRHELIHHITQLSHPEVDSLIAACETPEEYRQ